MAINKAQIRVIEKAPVLFKRQLLNLLSKHNTFLMNKGYIDYRPHTEFEELFTALNSETINYLISVIIKKNYDVYIDNFSPKEIYSYPELIDYILKKDISLLEYLDEEVITEDHISLLEKKDNTIVYLANKNRLPLKAYNNSKILEIVLKEASLDKYLDILEIVEKNYRDLLPIAIEIGVKKGVFDEYHFSMEKYLNNESVIKSIKHIDLNDILHLYQTNPSLATKVFLTFIKEGKVYGVYNPSVNQNLSIFDDANVLHAFSTSPNLYELDTYLSQIDIVNFSINDIVSIINKLKDSFYVDYPKNFFNNYLCLKLSIENKERNAFNGFNENIVKRYLTETTSFLDLKGNFEDLLYYIKNNSNLAPVNNPQLLADYIRLLKEKKCKNTYYFDIFTSSSFNNENMENYIDFINSLTDVYIFPNNLLNDRKLFNSLLTKGTNPALILQAQIKDITDDELDKIIASIKKSNTKYYLISDTFSNNTSFLMKLIENGITNSSLLALISNNIYTNEVINKIYHKSNTRIFEKLPIPIENVSNIIELEDDEFNKVLHLPDNDETLVRCLMVLKQSKINKNQLDSLESKCRNIMLKKDLPEREIDLYLKEMKKGNLDPLTALYIKTKKNLLFALYISDYYYDSNIEYINSLPLPIIERVNSKHLKDIVELLGKGKKDTLHLALNIYLSIGFERAINLLSTNSFKNYGYPDRKKIINIFNNIDINSITLKSTGNSFVPELNEEWINIIFGKNNKVKNTPIRNYLTDYEDKNEEINNNIQDIANLSKEEQDRRIAKNKLLLEKYIQNNDYFMRNASYIFNNWDVIKEEYLKSANNSKLKIKMNTNKIVEILNSIKALKNIDYDEIEDEELLKSDVLDYVGKDNQYIIYPAFVPARILELSREMNNIKTKKFPNIRISKNNYIIKTYNPQDRSILSTGYKYDCCFRPNGNADNPIENYRNPIFTTNGHSKDSLLRYCTSTEYGGCLEITDITGKPVLFSPLLRSGNVLLIHGVETKEELLPIHNELIIQYANKVVEDSYKNNDNIDFVLLGVSPKVDKKYYQGQVPAFKKFKYYNVSDEFTNMYNNIDIRDQLVVAFKKGKKIEDINYGEVEKSYSYPNNYYDHSCLIDPNLLTICQELDSLHKQYIVLGNKRFIAKESNNDHNSYELLTQMKKIKKQYLNKYNELLKKVKGRDYYKEIKRILKIISSLDKEITINALKDYSEVYYGKDWYIAITLDKEIICNSKPSGKDTMYTKLKEMQRLTNYRIDDRIEMVV